MNRFILCLFFALTTCQHAFATLAPQDKAELGVANNYILNGGAERGTAGFVSFNEAQTVTITIATPGVFTTPLAHNLNVNELIMLTTTGALPSGLTSGGLYYIQSVPSSTTFTVASSPGGAAVATSGSQSGTHTMKSLRPDRGGLYGTPTHLAITTSTTSPISLKRSFVISNSGSTAPIGEGFAYPFTIDQGDAGSTLAIKFKYAVQSGTFQLGYFNANAAAGYIPSDLLVFAYDVTNSKIIDISKPYLECNISPTAACNFSATIPTNTTSTSYRLLFFSNSINTAAWSLKVDNITVGPQLLFPATPSFDLRQVGLATITATTTAPTKPTSGNTETYQVGRVGDHSHVVWNFATTATTGSAPGTGDYIIALPPGVSFDPNKVVYNTTAYGTNPYVMNGGLGTATMTDGTSDLIGQVYPYDSTHYRIGGVYTNANTNGYGKCVWSASCFIMGSAATNKISVDFWAPTVGYSSQGSQTSDYSSITLGQQFTALTSTTVTANTALQFTSPSYDNVGTYTTANGFKAAQNGWYELYFSGLSITSGAGNLGVTVTSQTGNSRTYSGLATYSSTARADFVLPLSLNAGDLVTIIPDTAGTAVATGVTVSFQKKPGNATPVAGDPNGLKYSSGTATAAAANASVLLPVSTKVFDYLGGMSNGTWTASRPGRVSVSASFDTTATEYSVTQRLALNIQKTGAVNDNWFSYLNGNGATSNIIYTMQGQTIFDVVPGDKIQAYANSAVATNICNSLCVVSIFYIN